MSNSSPLKRKREENETLELTSFLNRFNKHELITSVIKTSSEEHSEIANERKATVIKEAIKLLTKEFADLDALILYLHLRYLLIQKKSRYWNILEIRNAKLSRPSEKVSVSMLKYFTKYNMKCRVYSEMTSSCNWIVFTFSSDKSKPVFCVVHIKLSLIFISYVPPEYLSVTKQIVRKSLKGKEIIDLASHRANAKFIQNLNRNKWTSNSKNEDIKKKIENKETAIENKDKGLGISQKQFKNKRKKSSWGKERRVLSFEDSENEECLENNVSANFDLQRQSHDERFHPEQEERSGIKNNTQEQIKNKKKNSEKKGQRALSFEESENEEFFGNNVLGNIDVQVQYDRRPEQEDRSGITNNSEKQIKSKTTNNRKRKGQRVLPFEESENEEFFGNNVLKNTDVQMQCDRRPVQEERSGIRNNSEKQIKSKTTNNTKKKDRRTLPFEESDNEEYLEHNISTKFVQEQEKTFGIMHNSDKQIKNKRKKNREKKDRRELLLEENETSECLESNAISNGDLRIQDERFEPEGEECFENNVQLDDVLGSEDERYLENGYPENNELPIITNLKYLVKSKEDEDNAFSYCIVKFHGTNILEGLNKLIQMGIADDPLPDYLYLEPRTGKTEFRITV